MQCDINIFKTLIILLNLVPEWKTNYKDFIQGHALLSLSLSLLLSPSSFITKSSIFGIQKMFPLPEGGSLLSYNFLLTHSALSLNTLQYLIELCR